MFAVTVQSVSVHSSAAELERHQPVPKVFFTIFKVLAIKHKQRVLGTLAFLSAKCIRSDNGMFCRF